MSKDRQTREQIDSMTQRIVDSQRQNGDNVDGSAVRERVRQSFIRNQREKNHQR